MAMRDEIREQRKKLKGKGIGAHLAWFWEYDKVPFILITLGVLFVIVLIYSMVTQKKTAFEIYALNAEAPDNTAVSESFEQQFAQAAGIDLSKENVTADFSEIQAVGTTQVTQYDLATSTKVTASVANKEMDVMLCDAWNFDSYADDGFFLDLSTVLDADTFASLKEENRIYYIDEALLEAQSEETDADATEEEVSYDDALASEKLDGFVMPDPSAMEKPVAVGILMNDAAYVKSAGLYTDTACIGGIIANTQHQDLAVQALDFLENTTYQEIQTEK